MAKKIGFPHKHDRGTLVGSLLRIVQPNKNVHINIKYNIKSAFLFSKKISFNYTHSLLLYLS